MTLHTFHALKSSSEILRNPSAENSESYKQQVLGLNRTETSLNAQRVTNNNTKSIWMALRNAAVQPVWFYSMTVHLDLSVRFKTKKIFSIVSLRCKSAICVDISYQRTRCSSAHRPISIPYFILNCVQFIFFVNIIFKRVILCLKKIHC